MSLSDFKLKKVRKIATFTNFFAEKTYRKTLKQNKNILSDDLSFLVKNYKIEVT